MDDLSSHNSSIGLIGHHIRADERPSKKAIRMSGVANMKAADYMS
jgi:hypothetical protein